MTENPHFSKIAKELNIKQEQVAAVALLLDNDATIPFIARYRKEVTGSANEVIIAQIRDRLAQLRELDKRRETILKTIEEQGKLTEELKKQIELAETLNVLEDLYLPYKPKRRTRATVAKEKGLEPLSQKIFEQEDFDIAAEAQKYISEEKGVNTLEEALAGARDIIAERINEDQVARASIRDLFEKQASFVAKVIPGKEDEGQKYKDYFEWNEKITEAPSHRVLALRRAEKEMIISLDLSPDEEEAIARLEKYFVKTSNEAGTQTKLAVKDAYKRLLKSSMETEIRALTKQKADTEAIKVFADNLRQLLLAPPLGQKSVLAIDPGLRTGCKVVCLDKQGQLVFHTVIYPDRRRVEATDTIRQLCEQLKIEAIAIGNGTGGRETEHFIREIGLPKDIIIVMVNESGASVYSASEVAREEFPEQDITVRGSVSIGRRLTDPLAELVKIDPKSIGVGQYQHDVDQTLLKKSLDDVVASCVNSVGVELNTASKELLTYVSGLGPQLAKNIVEYRNQNGAFPSRDALKNVSRLGDKAFEQAAGFLRISNASNPLDASAVHPESYPIVEKMAQDLNCSVADLIQKPELRKQINIQNYVTEQVGLPTLTDIMAELAKPGRDPRDKFEAVEFAEGVNSIEDLQVGMQLNGIITNITNFGAFVDVGVHQDGLVHISEMTNRFIKSPHDVVKVQQKVLVTVKEVDVARKRISFSMLEETDTLSKPKRDKKQGNPDRKKEAKPQDSRKKEAQPQENRKKETQPQENQQKEGRANKADYFKKNKPDKQKDNQGKPKTKPKAEPEVDIEDEFQAKLQALKNKFR